MNHSSNVTENIVMHSVRPDLPKFMLYYSCIKLCQETKGCAAIAFTETPQRRTCWLKASDEDKPHSDQSFVSLACIENTDHVFYPGFDQKVKEYLKHGFPCPEHFDIALSIGDTHCYLFEKEKFLMGQSSANIFCKRKRGTLITISSKWKKNALARELSKANIDRILVLLELKLGRFIFFKTFPKQFALVLQWKENGFIWTDQCQMCSLIEKQEGPGKGLALTAESFRQLVSYPMMIVPRLRAQVMVVWRTCWTQVCHPKVMIGKSLSRYIYYDCIFKQVA